MSALNDVAAIENFRLISGVLSQATNALKGFASQALQSYSHFEQMESSLQGVMRDTQKGTELFERLRKFSFDTTFGVDTLANASSQLLNTGTTMAELEPTLLQIGNIAQGDTNKFNELVSVFTKINNTGKASSVQLQQLALRGVPIYQVLKQIGVTGTATSKDIKKAFEVMTTSGGQFEGAMERINNTIQGKEGFISDTWREFLTSFSEASGLADAYKSALDTVYDALQGVVDWLLKINENPVAQAFFSGAVVALVVGIGGALIGSLVPALATVISQMTVMVALKTALAGPVGMVALGVGALVGVGVALAKSAKTADTEVRKLSANVDSFVSDVSDVKMELKEAQDLLNEWDGETAFGTDALEAYRLQLHEIALQIDDLYAQYGMEGADWTKDTPVGGIMTDTDVEYVNQLKSAYNDYLEKYNHVLAVTGSQNVMLEKQNALLQRQKEIMDEIAGDRDQATEWYNNTTEGQIASIRKEINRLQSDIETNRVWNTTDIGGWYQTTGEVKYTDEQLTGIQARIEELKKQLSELTGVTGWEDFINKYFDVPLRSQANVAVINKATGKNYRRSTLAYEEEALYVTSNSEKLAETMRMLGYSEEEVLNAYQDGADKLRTIATEMVNSGMWTADEEGVQMLVKSANQLQDKAKKASDAVKTLSQLLDESLQGVIEEYRNTGKLDVGAYAGAKMGQTALSITQGTDVGNAIQGFQQGGLWGAIINTLIGALAKVIGSLDTFDEVMNPVTEWMMQLKPLLEWVFDVTARINKAIGAVLAIIGVIVEALRPILDIITKVIDVLIYPLKVLAVLIKAFANAMNVIMAPIKAFMDWIKGLFGWTDELDDMIYQKKQEEQEELERLKKLNEQYANLSKAIEEQQQYYLAERKKLNAETMYDRLAFRDVNDMIITPQGVFNTSPQDTIMAMKHPESLMGAGGARLSVTINNNMADSAKVTATQTNDGQLFVTISKKIASDYASGANGWDNAVRAHKARIDGRRVLS